MTKHLTTLEFLERMAESPIGAVVMDRSDKKGDNQESLGIFLEDLASESLLVVREHVTQQEVDRVAR